MTIWKYTLKIEDEQAIEMPKGAELLCVRVQHGLPQLWADKWTDARWSREIDRIAIRRPWTHGERKGFSEEVIMRAEQEGPRWVRYRSARSASWMPLADFQAWCRREGTQLTARGPEPEEQARRARAALHQIHGLIAVRDVAARGRYGEPGWRPCRGTAASDKGRLVYEWGEVSFERGAKRYRSHDDEIVKRATFTVSRGEARAVIRLWVSDWTWDPITLASALHIGMHAGAALGDAGRAAMLEEPESNLMPGTFRGR